MSTILTVDPQFAKDVISFGGDGIRKCYQCGTCTAVCPVSEDITISFRRMIKYIQLGLAEKVLQLPAMWMCVACRDCVIECPRNANPSDILAALRRYTASRYSQYGLTKSLTLSPWVFGALLLIPTALLLAVVGLAGKVEADITRVGFVDFIPTIYVDIGGVAIGLVVLIGIIYNLLKIHSFTTQSKYSESCGGGLVKSFFKTVIDEVLTQRMMYKCSGERLRWLAHLAVFWGFAAAAATTTFAFILSPHGTPLDLIHPVKILGNISAVLLIFGITVLVARRIMKKDLETSYYDWLFLLLLYVVVITGVLSEVTRLISIVPAAQAIFLIHLITTAGLLTLAPFTKFAHSIYRPVMMFLGRLRRWVKL